MLIKSQENDSNILCPVCDLLIANDFERKASESVQCPRCSNTLRRGLMQNFYSQFAFSLTAFVLLIISNLHPLLYFQVLGMRNSINILEGIALLSDQGFYLVALSVLVASFIAPCLLFILICFTSLCLAQGWHNRYLSSAIRLQSVLTQWNMLEVFLVSFLVALPKLMELYDIDFGIGVWYITLTLMLSIQVVYQLKPYDYWERYDEIRP